MKQIALALLFLLVSTIAISQGCGQSNPGCIVPTAPPGTSNNQAASTAFVQNAIGGGGTAITGLTGDVSATGPGNVTATIQPGVVTNGKMAAGAAAANVGNLGGVLGGTLPNPTMAAGAAATNVGSLGGDLTGTLPNPTIAALAVTNAKMAAGAASANVGGLGGVLGGTLPNPTMAAGAAATNVGTLGGVLGGTLPNPTMAAGAAATNVGSLGGSLTGTLPNPTIAASAVTNAMLANEAASTVKCNATGSAAAPTDCSPNSVANLLGYCVIDGNTFAATAAGIQAAINTTSCKDIYIPPGTYSGTAQVQIARSNIRLRGAGGVQSEQTFANGTTASTIISLSCFNVGANPAFLVGDASATLTYGGINIEDLEIALPATCNMIGAQVNTSSPDVPNSFRRVRISQAAGTASGTGVFLGTNVYGWTFEHDVIDHFSTCYRLAANNNQTRILHGSCSDGNLGINAQNSTANETAATVVDGVDFENIVTAAIDIGAAEGFFIQNCYFGQGSGGVNSLSIRLGNVAAQKPLGVIITHNLFNAGGTANYAIDLENTAGFATLTIRDNYFVGFVTAAVHNLVTTNGSEGTFAFNHLESTAAGLSATNGFTLTNVGSLQALGSVNGGNGQLTLNGNVSGGYTIGSAGTGVPTMTTPWPIAAGGTGDTGTAWTAYTLTPSCGTATFTTTAARFKQLGKTTFVNITLLITAIGTCLGTTPLTVQAPATTQGTMILTGIESDNTGNFITCLNAGAAGTTLQCFKNGTFSTNWSTNDILQVAGVYEAQ